MGTLVTMDTVGGRYTIDGQLGEGGMGCVYRARHLTLGKAFALKLISPAFALDAVARQRFMNEAKLASEISHPNIVSVVDFGEDAAFGAYMVMELIEGEPLVAANGGPQSIRRTCDALAQIADALEHIHRRGIVHGDVKAENIMLVAETSGPRRRHTARLLDFGLARRQQLSAHGTREDQVSGSPHYLAPERAAGGPPSVLADVYALGVLGYLMIGGGLPFEGSVLEILHQHIDAQPRSLAERRGEDVDAALEALIVRAMAKEPRARHASAAAFRYELNAVMDMLALTQRKRTTQTLRAPAEATRDVGIAAAFERSRLPQAFLSATGTIAIANKAFCKLLGRAECEGVAIADTSLADVVPGAVRTILRAHETGKSQECRAFVGRGDRPGLELSVWASPLPIEGQEIHVIVRVVEGAT